MGPRCWWGVLVAARGTAGAADERRADGLLGWIAPSVYLSVAITKKRFAIERDLYTILHILSVYPFEKTPLAQALLLKKRMRFQLLGHVLLPVSIEPTHSTEPPPD